VEFSCAGASLQFYLFSARERPVPLAKKAELATLVIGSSFPTVDLCDGRSADRMYRRVLSGPIFDLLTKEYRIPDGDACRNGGFTGRGRNIPLQYGWTGFVAFPWLACEGLHSHMARALAFSLFAGMAIFSLADSKSDCVFKGEVPLSTLKRARRVEGILTPQGRAFAG